MLVILELSRQACEMGVAPSPMAILLILTILTIKLLLSLQVAGSIRRFSNNTKFRC